jgi:hypothetical protein
VRECQVTRGSEQRKPGTVGPSQWAVGHTAVATLGPPVCEEPSHCGSKTAQEGDENGTNQTEAEMPIVLPGVGCQPHRLWNSPQEAGRGAL